MELDTYYISTSGKLCVMWLEFGAATLEVHEIVGSSQLEGFICKQIKH